MTPGYVSGGGGTIEGAAGAPPVAPVFSDLDALAPEGTLCPFAADSQIALLTTVDNAVFKFGRLHRNAADGTQFWWRRTSFHGLKMPRGPMRAFDPSQNDANISALVAGNRYRLTIPNARL